LQNELLPIRTTAAAVLCAAAHGLCKETHKISPYLGSGHLIKSVQNNTRLKISPRYRKCFFSCLISKSSKISHDQHFCSTSYEILQCKKIICCSLPEFAKITPNLRDTISCWQQHYLKFSTLLERAASRHTWHLALQQYFSHPRFLISLFPKAPPNLSMKEGSLFCSYEIHRTGMLQIVFLVSRESSRRGGVHGLGSTTFGLAVQKFLNIE
jgi:hypothetical protein